MEVGPQYNFLSIKLSVANIMQLKRIDFNSSNIISPGSSTGIYKLVSILIMNDLKNNDKCITYGLGQGVLAGNMFIEKGLLKKPPYLFQILGSVNDQKIFRTSCSPQSKQPHNLPSCVQIYSYQPLDDDPLPFRMNLLQLKSLELV